MPRTDPRFRGEDLLRLFENNLQINEKRFIIAWFFALIPVKEPKVDTLGILLNLLSLIPVTGTFARIFEISIQTAQAAAEIAELFQFEPEEEEVEIAKLQLELESLEQAFRELREEERRLLDVIDDQRELLDAFRATERLLRETIARIDADRTRILQAVSFHIGRLSTQRQIVVDRANEARFESRFPEFSAAFNEWSRLFREFVNDERIR